MQQQQKITTFIHHGNTCWNRQYLKYVPKWLYQEYLILVWTLHSYACCGVCLIWYTNIMSLKLYTLLWALPQLNSGSAHIWTWTVCMCVSLNISSVCLCSNILTQVSSMSCRWCGRCELLISRLCVCPHEVVCGPQEGCIIFVWEIGGAWLTI